MLAPEHGVCSGFWRVYAYKVIPLVIFLQKLPSHAGPLGLWPQAELLSELSLGFPPQTGWLAGSTGTLPAMAIHCPVSALPPLPALVSVSWSERLSQQQQPHRTALCTQELNIPSVLGDLHYPSRAAAHQRAVLKPHIPASRPCPVLLVLFHSPGHINADCLHSPSLNVCFYLPGENDESGSQRPWQSWWRSCRAIMLPEPAAPGSQGHKNVCLKEVQVVFGHKLNKHFKPYYQAIRSSGQGHLLSAGCLSFHRQVGFL